MLLVEGGSSCLVWVFVPWILTPENSVEVCTVLITTVYIGGSCCRHWDLNQAEIFFVACICQPLKVFLKTCCVMMEDMSLLDERPDEQVGEGKSWESKTLCSIPIFLTPPNPLFFSLFLLVSFYLERELGTLQTQHRFVFTFSEFQTCWIFLLSQAACYTFCWNVYSYIINH